MILVMGCLREPMVAEVVAELESREADFEFVSTDDLPGQIRLDLGTRHRRLLWPQRDSLDLQSVKAIYQRVGFAPFGHAEDFSETEIQFVSQECSAALVAMLNSQPGLVVNRPVASGSNASKPYQIQLFGEFGFLVPHTLVTNQPEMVRDFYRRCKGQVIYKSISYSRSIVQALSEDDFDRLDTLVNCPVQLQEKIEGTDLRVHVVGQQTFASHIEAQATDYRFDKEADIVAVDLPEEIAQACVLLASRLELHLAGIDLRRTPSGQYYCFEVNPSPAFTWYEARTEQPITAALVDLLMR